MKTTIWYNDYEKGKEQLEKIIDNYERCQIEAQNKVIGKRDSFVKFKNGHFIRMVPAVESFRGIKCNISIVERSINEEYFNNIIIPCTMNLPIQGFKFFGEGELRL